MIYTSEQHLEGGFVERGFTLGESVGLCWMPEQVSSQCPLILLGHPGGLQAMYPRLLGRARRALSDGFAAASIELPGSGVRPAHPVLELARTELRGAIQSGQAVSAELVDGLVLPLVEQSVPEWVDALDALLAVPGIGGPVGYSGGNISIGVRFARVEPRIVAAGLFAGSFIPQTIVEEARSITKPVHMLLQWDDEVNDRQSALELFDALGSAEKTLQANMGGHTGVPPFAGEDAARFFARHLSTPEPDNA